MKKKTKIVVTVCILMTFFLAFGMTAGAGFRRMPNGRYRYYTSSKKYIAGKNSGALQNRWVFKNIRYKGEKYTYCFDSKGYMLTGWQRIYTTSSDHITGWSCYYFNKNGQMYKNRKSGNRYFLGNGRLVNSYGLNGKYYGIDGIETKAPSSGGRFVTDKKGTRYRMGDGTYVTKTWKCIRENSGAPYYWYYFYGSGYMAKSRWVGSHYVDQYGRLTAGKSR